MRDKMMILLLFLSLVLAFLSYKLGKVHNQKEIEARIWPHQKYCYNEQDLEIIVFGTVQE